MGKAGIPALAALAACLASLAGCSAGRHHRAADREVYRIISEKETDVLGGETGFSLDYRSFEEDRGGIAGEGVTSLDLPAALELAARYSREYQSEKEGLYLSALTLTAERYNWEPRVGAAGVTARARRSGGAETVAVDGGVTLVQWLADGARVTLNLTSDFFRHPRESLAAAVSANILQPLFRGAGRRIARENLTLAEREVVYRVRSFVRYQRTFSVSVAVAWFGLLQQKMMLDNRESNYERLAQNRERAEMMGEAGRIPMLQVDQARQNELAARNALVSARADYQAALDRFKAQLGLPVEIEIGLSEEYFRRYSEAPLPEPGPGPDEAREIALRERMDLLNARDAVEDARRAVDVAGDGLRPRLDLSASAASGREYRTGLELELPVNRVGDRNAYRRSLISLERSQRGYELNRDNVSLQVAAARRALEEARQSHEIQSVSLALARRRVDSVNLLLEAGRATQRDILDAEDALLDAQNGLARALIAYYNSYLAFLRDIERLPLGDNGLWTGGFHDGQET